MTRKKIKPSRALRPSASASAPASSRRFAVVPVSERTIEVVNLDRIVLAVFRVLPEGDDVEINLWTEIEAARSDGDGDPIRFTGKAAADLLAHLVLIGMHVEGARAHLANAEGGELFAPYFAPLDKLDEEGEEPGDDAERAEVPIRCEGCHHRDSCPFGYKADDAGACEHWRPVECGDCAHTEGTCPGFSFNEPFDGSTCLRYEPNAASAANLAARGIPAADLATEAAEYRRAHRATFERFKAAAAELRAHEATAPTIRAEAAETRASCAFGEKCKRFPACDDCSLYALDRECEALHRGEVPPSEHGRRVVHVEHVEEVSGEKSAALLARVERCNVFGGMKRAGVVPGDKWCGVGHEMTDPACALCPYLRIYAPITTFEAR